MTKQTSNQTIYKVKKNKIKLKKKNNKFLI